MTQLEFIHENDTAALTLIASAPACNHPAEAFADEGVCIICKGQGLQHRDELLLFRSRLEEPRVRLAGEGKVVRMRRWWREFWS